MNCRYCGYEIPDEELYCENCGKEVQIVPDYNPLDDVLTAQIRGSIDGGEMPLDDYEYTAVRNEQKKRSQTAKRGHTARQEKQLTTNPRERRRQAEKRRALKRKQRRKILILLSVGLLVLISLGIVLYQTSYTGQVKKGDKATVNRAFSKAEAYYKKAISKKPKKAPAYTGLAHAYVQQDNIEEGETLFLDAIDKYPGIVVLYEACIQFYVNNKQETGVSALLEDAPDKIREELNIYISGQPKFSLDDAETYDDVQQLTLTTSGKEMYYTTDGTTPTTASTKYVEPILIQEGETTISAISVNKKSIPSLVASRTYLIELPIEDAPAVSPSTGQYSKATQITIQVPEGYTAHYTLDRTDPTATSTKYEGPVDMPEGETIFKAILVNLGGRTSGITTRNYERVTE